MDFEKFQWLYVAIVAPVLGVLGGWLRAWWVARRDAKRRRDFLVAWITGLPDEVKSVFIYFYDHGTHSCRGDPSSPPIKFLIHCRVIHVSTGGGGYEAVDSYLTIRPDIWKVMDDWIVSDIDVVNRVREQFFD